MTYFVESCKAVTLLRRYFEEPLTSIVERTHNIKDYVLFLLWKSTVTFFKITSFMFNRKEGLESLDKQKTNKQTKKIGYLVCKSIFMLAESDLLICFWGNSSSLAK